MKLIEIKPIDTSKPERRHLKQVFDIHSDIFIDPNDISIIERNSYYHVTVITFKNKHQRQTDEPVKDLIKRINKDLIK